MTGDEWARADLWATGVSPEGHPTRFIREHLDSIGVVTATGLADVEPGERVLVGGVVTHRQRPATAGGTLFVNLEDETGLINVVVSKGCWTAHRQVARSAPAMLVRGRLERSEGVTNVIADRLEAPPARRAQPRAATSADAATPSGARRRWTGAPRASRVGGGEVGQQHQGDDHHAEGEHREHRDVGDPERTRHHPPPPAAGDHAERERDDRGHDGVGGGVPGDGSADLEPGEPQALQHPEHPPVAAHAEDERVHERDDRQQATTAAMR